MGTASESTDTSHLEDTQQIVSLKLPDFSSTNTRVWLIQVEAQFHAKRISSQNTKFYSLVAALPTSVAEQLVDVIEPIPPITPYDTLRAALLDRTSASDQLRMQQLLSGVELGDRTPSQLLRHMRSLVGNLKVDDSILRQLWSKQLPANTNAILSTSDPETSLDVQARMADKIHECLSSSVIGQVSNTDLTDSSRLSRLEQQVATLSTEVNKLTVAVRSSQPRRRSSSRRHFFPVHPVQ